MRLEISFEKCLLLMNREMWLLQMRSFFKYKSLWMVSLLLNSSLLYLISLIETSIAFQLLLSLQILNHLMVILKRRTNLTLISKFQESWLRISVMFIYPYALITLCQRSTKLTLKPLQPLMCRLQLEYLALRLLEHLNLSNLFPCTQVLTRNLIMMKIHSKKLLIKLCQIF